MTTATPEIALPAEPGRRRSGIRFLVAFLVGLLIALAIGVTAMYAYDQQYTGRILPGVRIGSVDVSGLAPEAAAERLQAAYGGVAEGAVVLEGPDGPIELTYRDLGRRADIDGMVADAMAVGRAGNPIERMVADARTAIRGVTVAPRVTFDPELVARRITAYVGFLRQDPVDAAIVKDDEERFILVPGQDGRRGDPTPAIEGALAALGRVDAPATIALDVPLEAITPNITTVEGLNAKAAAERLTKAIVLTVEDSDKDPQQLSVKRLRSWTTFETTAEGTLQPVVDTSDLRRVLGVYAKRIDQAPVNASFKTRGGKIVGVTPSKPGYAMDPEATALKVEAALAERAAGAALASVPPALEVTQPILTTAEAEAVVPKMRRISRWTTYFPISEKNGNGANIWIPARLIDGYVVAPGATFDFWDAVGPVTREKGYTDGGAIINGRTEPQGALAGGICSCSTTLFNAALRAGYEMGDRRNHYYYIDRYPLGLDATVFISASGSRQTMSFTNDTRYPILIRGRGWREGGAGYVRFDLYSVPTGRSVSFSRPVVKNVRPASDTVEYTSSLPAGTAKRIEYPVDGKQVWVTRTVRDKAGKVIHKDTYYSNYARITGVTLVGR
jgi:vancomycin resistance protein YoaR